MHRHLGEYSARLLQPLDEFEGHRAGVRFEVEAVERRLGDEAEIAVGVADMQAERQLDYPVVGPADDDPEDRVLARDFVTLHYIYFWTQRGDHQRKLVSVVLRVPIRVK